MNQLCSVQNFPLCFLLDCLVVLVLFPWACRSSNSMHHLRGESVSVVFIRRANAKEEVFTKFAVWQPRRRDLRISRLGMLLCWKSCHAS